MMTHWFSNRWVQLSAGVLSLVAVANFQYAWTFFVLPMQRSHGWNREDIQIGFSLFLLAQTWLVPIEAYLAERLGPRLILLFGGLLPGLAWVINSTTDSLYVLYLSQILSGCGSGIAYGISIGNALKWFPDRRGLAAGLTAAAFGAGSAATVLPIQAVIREYGYETAFLWFGLAQGIIVVLAGLVMRFPHAHEVPAVVNPKLGQSGRDYTPRQVLRTPVFWLLYAMMTMGAVPGLLMTARMAEIALDFGISQVDMIVLGMSFTALSLAVMVDRIMGGLTRPVFGWVSDRIGRELAMFVAFAVEGGAMLLLISYPANPVIFVLMSGLAFFGWGAVFSLFPAASGDMFGRRFATTNYALLYTAKGAASLIILGCNRLQTLTGSWVPVFGFMIACDWLAALLAISVLRRWRDRHASAQVLEIPSNGSPASYTIPLEQRLTQETTDQRR